MKEAPKYSSFTNSPITNFRGALNNAKIIIIPSYKGTISAENSHHSSFKAILCTGG